MLSEDTPKAENPVLWRPSAERVARSRMTGFMERVGLAGASYAELHRWSVTELEAFWAALWEDAGLAAHAPYHTVLSGRQMLGARWFAGSRLNFAENLLRRADDAPALIGEAEDGARRVWSFAELRRDVARCQRGLARAGVGCGDRVAGYLPNVPETIIAMLAAASLGAVWSSCSPDFGVAAVVDRLAQVEPKVVFYPDAYRYDGKVHGCVERAAAILQRIQGVRAAVQLNFVEPGRPPALPGALLWDDLLGEPGTDEPTFVPVPFDHPLFILFSSGTTGLPKAIVHGTGGPLLNFHKEHALHGDLQPDDVLFYFTTCGWMMWNWLAGALLQGSTVVCYDGSPFYPDDLAMWRLALRNRVTHFGTSAKYLSVCQKRDVRPRELPGFGERLRTVFSTGSPLHPGQFDWVYAQVAADLDLASISGGTDILGCFVLGAPILPVRRGEIQCRGLGLAVEVFDEQGRSLPPGEKGELVCTAPFPNQPVHLLHDPDGARYRATYFSRFSGVWHHGDLMELTPTGGAVIYGRSDTTLNPGGVRIGTAEIDRIVQRMPEVADSVVVGIPEEDDVAVVLCVVLKPGHVLDDALRKRIAAEIRGQASPRHVPRHIFAVEAVPYTVSGKKVEAAVRNRLLGRPVPNVSALANPEALAAYDGLLKKKG